MQKNLAVYSMSLAGVPHPDRRRAQSDIAAWTASPGHILSVAARFPLYETAAAHNEVERGGKVGTVIVEPQPGSWSQELEQVLLEKAMHAAGSMPGPAVSLANAEPAHRSRSRPPTATAGYAPLSRRWIGG